MFIDVSCTEGKAESISDDDVATNSRNLNEQCKFLLAQRDIKAQIQYLP